MATFLTQSPPQPGDGTFLTQTINEKLRRARRRQRGKKPMKLSFLPQDAHSIADEEEASELQHFSKTIPSFLDREGDIDNRRTISDNTFLAPRAEAVLDAYDTPEHFTFLHHPQPLRQIPNFVTMPARYDYGSNASTTVKASIPPHLRAKHAAEAQCRSKTDNAALLEKLQALGAKVGSPKAVTKSAGEQFDALVSPRNAESAPVSQGSDLSGRGRGRGGGRGGTQGKAWDRRDSKHISESFVKAKDHTGTGPSTTWEPRRGADAAARNSQWPSRKDFPDPPPDRWKTDWAGTNRNSWDSTTIESGRASSGWGTKQKKRDARQAGVPLTGFDGNFAPPPVDWDCRPAFRDGQTYDQIMQWMAGIETLLCGITRRVPIEEVTAGDGITYVFSVPGANQSSTQNDTRKQMGEIAPQHWVPVTLGRKAPGSFWDEVMPEEPRPCDPEDLVGARPWWEKHVKAVDPENNKLHFLKDVEAPAELGVDPNEEDADQKLKRKHDLGSLTHAENRIRLEIARKDAKLAKQRKAAAKQERLTAVIDNMDHHRIKTGVSLFVRAARKEDMAAITEIYNYYITSTCSTPELDRRTKENMHQRWQDVRLNRMPYLVACERGGVIKARNNKKKKSVRTMRGDDEDVILPDKIIGFAFADDFNDLKGMYRFTAEMEVYVHNDYYMKGVGKCLLDKLMGLLDGHYLERGGYDAVGENIDGTGQQRVVKNIVVHLSYDKPEKLEWVGKWLEGWLQFRKVGQLEGIGTKNGKAVSMAIFQRETGEPLNHANPPIMMEYPTTVG
ncbi:unnamed protein product [Zymoseptoria tritici ST99CH_3D7]|uniref:N-acetyltransferase domain-containing protein n=1 Tax=Zymoseptoria tritici (strain ST99CH_3D7) TaxID=1276538 RepID=A0A1X7RJH4_ZYMT9|nr:unnamed protein product [Zymoseptoria tritici ST99CH_3D7]